jgi:hypothetical protein
MNEYEGDAHGGPDQHVEDDAASIEELKKRVRDYEDRIGQPAPSDKLGSFGELEQVRPPREPRTIDGEVLPIEMEFGDGEGDGEATPDNVLADAIADHFGIDPSQITGFVAAVEHSSEQGVTLSSVWSLGVPAWRLRSFAVELGEHLKQV